MDNLLSLNYELLISTLVTLREIEYEIHQSNQLYIKEPNQISILSNNISTERVAKRDLLRRRFEVGLMTSITDTTVNRSPILLQSSQLLPGTNNLIPKSIKIKVLHLYQHTFTILKLLFINQHKTHLILIPNVSIVGFSPLYHHHTGKLVHFLSKRFN